ncbi:hypothetical protein [Paenarthrobacter histidinolovorans]|uniref:Uncharacterized protein n=1 Tax=Paenarthrobacter histidinolovorans TaxID=43664 RepID=A0ABW8MZN1_9MICC
MNIIELAGIIGAIFAVVAVVVAVAQYYRSNPKQRLTLKADSVALIRTRQPLLSVSYDGEEIIDPRLVTATLECTGRTDIASARFDAGRPIMLQTGSARVVALLGTNDPAHQIALSEDRQTITIGPTLLRRKDRVTVRFLMDGQGELAWTANMLIDVQIDYRDSAASRNGWLSGAKLLLPAAVLTTLSLFNIWSK